MLGGSHLRLRLLLLYSECHGSMVVQCMMTSRPAGPHMLRCCQTWQLLGGKRLEYEQYSFTAFRAGSTSTCLVKQEPQHYFDAPAPADASATDRPDS